MGVVAVESVDVMGAMGARNKRGAMGAPHAMGAREDTRAMLWAATPGFAAKRFFCFFLFFVLTPISTCADLLFAAFVVFH